MQDAMHEPVADERGARPQTGAQWAVRWCAVVAFLVLTLPVPLLHAGWHWLAGRAEPLVRTRSQTAPPVFGWLRLLHGRPGDAAGPSAYLTELGRHLQEDSPLVWELRGIYNEWRYVLGLLQTPAVHVGRDGWMYMRPSLRPDLQAWAARAAARQRFLRDLRARADALGVALVVAVVPDKERIHPEQAYPDGRMPAGKEGFYPRILAELGAAGITAVDLWQPMRDARRRAPDVPLYYQRDSHWRPGGALLAARAVAARIEALPSVDLGPRLPVELGPAASHFLVPDLAALCGFRSVDVLEGGVAMALPASWVANLVAETDETYGVVVRTDHGVEDLEARAGQAAVLLAGTSFSASNGARALMLALGRPVRVLTATGAGGMEALQRALTLLQDGSCGAKVLVWEFVERGQLEQDWLRPSLAGAAK